MTCFDVMIIGAGAAGSFAAAILAEQAPELKVAVLEKARLPLKKVRVSGGGRCNLTHQCTSIPEFAGNYPRGGRELIGAFNRFGPHETMAWFERHHVPLVILEDGCVFPKSDTSEDVIQALLACGVKILTGAAVTSIQKTGDLFCANLANKAQFVARKLLIATGGGAFFDGIGHTIEPCVPSLFTFRTADGELSALAGNVIENVRVSALGCKAEGALLITHSGVSGPAVLRISSFGARAFAACQYAFELKINWTATMNDEQVFQSLEAFKRSSPRKKTGTWSPVGLPSRLWQLIVKRAGVDEATDWGSCSFKMLRKIALQVTGFTLAVTGKNTHREEFVTCGGIRLKEVDFKTMQSRITPGLYFAGEVLDLDGLTGGFNLQAAWTTGYLAAQSIQASLRETQTGRNCQKLYEKV
jgi:predicted Rossmann fold flavoprotein